jgi:hypothetical protein
MLMLLRACREKQVTNLSLRCSNKQKQTPWPLVGKGTILSDRFVTLITMQIQFNLSEMKYSFEAISEHDYVINNGAFWDVTPCGSYKN